MNRFSIKVRLVLLVIGLLALLLAITAAGISNARRESAALGALIRNQIVPIQQLKEVSDGYAVGVVDAAHKTRDGAFSREEGIQAVTEARGRIRRAWSAYLAKRVDKREHLWIQKGAARFDQADAAIEKLLQLMHSGDAAALRVFAGKDIYPAIDPVSEVLDALIRIQLDVVAEDYKLSVDNTKQLFWIGGVGVSAALVIAVAMAWAIIRSIVVPLGLAVDIARRVAAGDLRATIGKVNRDETGRLLSALGAMNTNLSDIVRRVRESAQAVVQSSSDVFSGSLDLNQRTEAQAATLQQAASSMEELTATVRNSAETAQAASLLASGASASAVAGGNAVQAVVRTMERVSVASSQMADIIAVIDRIAFQTNILALNAAVEAARAGEQGRGFAVVAGEVRALAQRSTVAAREIKSLIGQNVSQVEVGYQLAKTAGETMTQVVDQFTRVHQLMSEIGLATADQSRGLEQVASAVLQLDQVTQQNAALVEKSAASAEGLNHQALLLMQAVSAFQLPTRQ